MNLVDSSGWLEYLADAPNCAFFSPILEATEDLLVSTINIYEVFKRVLQQRGEEEALRAAALMEQALVVEVTAPIAMSAAKLSMELGLPMAHSLILATARAHSAVLWTQDADFEGLDGVRLVKK
ncbi:MAG: twitching motility protein PilT [Planctomycetes bacterium RBG_13_60_9]|nr:MAG: twitching motility protein PilT [Planctomycetes bacterium RBG_13_60_9]